MTPEETRKIIRSLDGIHAALETISFTLKVLQGQIGSLDDTLNVWTPTATEYQGEEK